LNDGEPIGRIAAHWYINKNLIWAEIVAEILSIAGYMSLGWYFNEVEKDGKRLKKINKQKLIISTALSVFFKG
jgi:Mg2+/citrate symporter